MHKELDELKEYSIAVQVFGREESFDPTTDNIVRVEARRLRTRLAEYYSSEGRFDPLLIDIRKGSYIPHFSTRTFQDEYRLADALSQYQIAERLGVMSDGVLYRSTDVKLGRKVLLWVTSCGFGFSICSVGGLAARPLPLLYHMASAKPNMM